MQDFKSLKVWQKAHELVLMVYRETGGFPTHEVYGLRAQLRRACVSIAANIVEGCGRGTDPDFARFLTISMGSAAETEYLLLLSRDLGYLPPETHAQMDGLLSEVKRMLSALLARVRATES